MGTKNAASAQKRTFMAMEGMEHDITRSIKRLKVNDIQQIQQVHSVQQLDRVSTQSTDNEEDCINETSEDDSTPVSIRSAANNLNVLLSMPAIEEEVVIRNDRKLGTTKWTVVYNWNQCRT